MNEKKNKSLGQNQQIVNNVIVHTHESVISTGAKKVNDHEKIKKFILAGKVPNGTNGVYL